VDEPLWSPRASTLSVLGRWVRGDGLLPPVWAVGVVMAGGAIGTAARYGLGQRFPVAPGTFPATTLVENVLGAALLGLLLSALIELGTQRRWVRPLLATGVLGSFTTFSTFATEAVLLVRDDRAALAAAYVGLTVVLGIAAAAAGISAGRGLVGRPTSGARR
jgi:fluoride exporter